MTFDRAFMTSFRPYTCLAVTLSFNTSAPGCAGYVHTYRGHFFFALCLDLDFVDLCLDAATPILMDSVLLELRCAPGTNDVFI